MAEKQKFRESRLAKSAYFVFMTGAEDSVGKKYSRIEIAFLAFLFYLAPIMSSVEFSYHEKGNAWLFTEELEYRLVTGTFSFLFYSVVYWGFVKRYVFERKSALLLLCMVAFIPLHHLYDKYIMDWGMSRLGFLSEDIRTAALRAFQLDNSFFVVSYTLLREMFVIVGFAFVIRSLQQDEQMKALKEQQLTTELNYLKTQLQPHFFFNTLNNIYGLAMQQSAQTAPMVARLSEMMRYMLYESDKPRVPLQQDIAFLRNYIGIEQIRYPERHCRISFDVQGIAEHHHIEPLLLLPFVENAFKHGIREELSQGFVHIVVCASADDLTLQVSNSKPGPVADRQPAGIGLLNARKRLELLYRDRYQLHFTESNNTYEVNLTLAIR